MKYGSFKYGQYKYGDTVLSQSTAVVLVSVEASGDGQWVKYVSGESTEIAIINPEAFGKRIVGEVFASMRIIGHDVVRSVRPIGADIRVMLPDIESAGMGHLSVSEAGVLRVVRSGSVQIKVTNS